MKQQKVTFLNADGHNLSAILNLPEDEQPIAYALFAHLRQGDGKTDPKTHFDPCQGPWKIYGDPAPSLRLAEEFLQCRCRMARRLTICTNPFDCLQAAGEGPAPAACGLQRAADLH